MIWGRDTSIRAILTEWCMIASMQAVLATLALLGVIGLALVLLTRGWVRSSRLGGYGVAHGPEGRKSATGVPQEDDDVRWHWGDEKPER